jgi:hypothetical protein
MVRKPTKLSSASLQAGRGKTQLSDSSPLELRLHVSKAATQEIKPKTLNPLDFNYFGGEKWLSPRHLIV